MLFYSSVESKIFHKFSMWLQKFFSIFITSYIIVENLSLLAILLVISLYFINYNLSFLINQQMIFLYQIEKIEKFKKFLPIKKFSKIFVKLLNATE